MFSAAGNQAYLTSCRRLIGLSWRRIRSTCGTLLLMEPLPWMSIRTQSVLSVPVTCADGESEPVRVVKRRRCGKALLRSREAAGRLPEPSGAGRHCRLRQDWSGWWSWATGLCSARSFGRPVHEGGGSAPTVAANSCGGVLRLEESAA